MTISASMRRRVLAAVVALAPGLAAAQDASPGPKLPAMPSLEKDTGDMSKPAGALPPPAKAPEKQSAKATPKPDDSKKKPEPAKSGEGKKADARKPDAKKAETKKAEPKKAEPKKSGAKKAKESGKRAPRAASRHAAAKHAAAKPHAARHGKKH